MLVESGWYLIRAGKQILEKSLSAIPYSALPFILGSVGAYICKRNQCLNYFIPDLKSSCVTAAAGTTKVNRNCLPEVVAVWAQGGHPLLVRIWKAVL